MKLPKDRIPYSAIVDRPPLKLPDGARMAVWTIVNVEEWSIERNMPRTVLPPPYGQPLLPDLPNWAWHEYGMRVGFWRFVEVPEELRHQGHARDQRLGHQELPARGRGGARGGLGIHGPRLHPAADAPRRGPAGGDLRHRSRRSGRSPARRRAAGKARASPKPTTPIDRLAEAGIEYVADWVLDDQP